MGGDQRLQALAGALLNDSRMTTSLLRCIYIYKFFFFGIRSKNSFWY